MAIPDLRSCFDFYQFPTALTEWLQAYFEDKSRPTPFDIFRHKYFLVNNFGFLSYPRDSIELQNQAAEVYAALLASIKEPSSFYEDVHCSFFVPASFLLLIQELRLLGLTDFMVESISDTHGNEFFVTLVKSPNIDRTASQGADDNARRKEIMSMLNFQIAFKAFDGDALSAFASGNGLSSHSLQTFSVLQRLMSQINRLRFS